MCIEDVTDRIVGVFGLPKKALGAFGFGDYGEFFSLLGNVGVWASLLLRTTRA